MTKIRVAEPREAYSSDTLRKAVDVLDREGILPLRSERDSDGRTLICVSQVHGAMAVALLKRAGIDASEAD